MDNPKKFQTGNVITITLAHLIHDVYSSFLAPLLPLLIDKLSISYTMAGLLTVFQRIPAFLNPVIGIVADKIAIRYVLIISPALTAVSMSLIGVASSYTLVVILLVTAGFGSAMFHVPGPVMIKFIAGNRIGKGMSFFMLGGELARSIAPVFILGAVSIWGLEGSYKVMPVGVLASVILFFKFRNIKISDKFKKESKEKTLSIKNTFYKYLPLFIKITGIYIFISLLKSTFTAFLPTFLTTEGSSLWEGGIALAILQLTGAIGAFMSGTISDKFGRRNTLLVTAIVAPVLTLLFLVVKGAVMFMVLIILGFFLISSTPVILAITNELQSEHPGFINGIQMTINFVTGALSVFIVGLMGDIFGLYITYITCAFLSLLSIPIILSLKKK